MVTVTGGFEQTHSGKHTARFRNDAYELTLSIEPRYRASASQQRSKTRQPASFRVRLSQDMYSRKRDRSKSATVPTWAEAVEIAEQFMREFETERGAVDDTEMLAAHRSSETHEEAEAELTLEAATEVLTDAAGFSNDLLRDAIRTETGGKHFMIVHRTGSELDLVTHNSTRLIGGVDLETVLACFPVDATGVDSSLPGDEPIVTTVHLDENSVYRFGFGYGQETFVVLPRGTQVESPTFETILVNVLEEKWR